VVVAAAGVGGLTIAGILRPAPVLAAEVAIDHRKCLLAGPEHSGATPAELEPSWLDWQGWSLRVPTGAAAHMHVLGYRRCYLTEGRTAHVMYERDGAPLSLFVLPEDVGVGRRQLEIFGQDAVLWTSGGRTYALVGPAERFDRAMVAEMAISLERELETPRAGAGSDARH
jgi:hypothetical protein